MPEIAIIGSGLAGLSSACVLGARGYQVTVYEKNEWTGGKAAVLEQDGYRFDMGPTILTIPSVLRRIFREAGARLEDRLDLIRIDPQWRCFFDDNSSLDLIEDVEGMATKLSEYSRHEGDAAGYRAFLKVSESLNAISQEYFFWKPVGNVMDVFRQNQLFNLNGLRNLANIMPGRTVAGVVRKHVKDPRVAQMLDHFVQYVGSSPEQSPAVLCGIAHMQTDEGIWYPRGGTAAVPRALRKLAEELGVRFRNGREVMKIETAGARATALRMSDGERIPVDSVISNMDAVRTFRELLGGRLEQRFEPKPHTPACSGVVLYLGLDRRYEQLLHHDFVFSRDPHEEFDFIYRQGKPAPDPSLYLAAPAITEPEVAPPGCEALYVLAHTPYLRPGQNWSAMLPAYRKVILQKLERTAGLKNLESHIRFEAHLTPQDIHERYNVLNGAIYGLASHGLNGAFKPSNRTELENLYLAGGAAHPGPGMPMVLMSGWIAGDTLDRDLAGAPRAGRSLVSF